MSQSIEKLRERIPEWSLVDDVALLSAIDESSAKFKKRGVELQKSVDEFLYESSGLSIALNNTFSTFMLLSHAEFIESRVYEGDDAFTRRPKTSETSSGSVQ